MRVRDERSRGYCNSTVIGIGLRKLFATGEKKFA
jgi:hypothetical protein